MTVGLVIFWPLPSEIVPIRNNAAARCPSCLLSSAPLRTARAAEADFSTQPRLLEQKAVLLEGYLKSPAVRRIRTGTNARAKALVTEAERMLEQARALRMPDELTEVSAILDEALRKVSSASVLTANDRPARSQTQERLQYNRLHGQISSLLDLLPAEGSEGETSEGVDAWPDRVNSHIADAERLAGAGRYAEANVLLAQAYRTVVAVISGQRRGQTLVSQLIFEAPQEELDYERRRNDSYEMLVGIIIYERSESQTDLRSLLDRFLRENRDLREDAEALAATGDYRRAIGLMERATRRLVRGLQAAGVPIPE